MLDSQQDTTSPGAWQRHCDEETVCHASLITHQTKPVPPSNLQESLALNLSSSSSHGRPRQPASPTLAGSPRENANPNNPSPQSLGTCLWHSACLSLTFSSAPNQPDPLACRKPKKSVSRAAHSDLSSHNPSWLHEIALMHASKPDPQPRWRWVQCWGLAYMPCGLTSLTPSPLIHYYYIHRGLLFKGSSSNVY